MSVLILSDRAAGDSVLPARASAHLLAISKHDPGYGEGEGPAPDLVQVSYERSQSGWCPERLDELVNTGLLPDGTADIVVVAAGGGFTLNDGSILDGGVALPPGFTTPGGITLNPSTAALVIYDASGDGPGRCVRCEEAGLGVGPAPAVLYHELSHALRICRGGVLDAAVADGDGPSAEETAAIADENDMRDQLGVPRRPPDRRGGDAGCRSRSSCVAAAVACGSPLAAEIAALRELRDRSLRRSAVGFDLFERLHADYFRLSPRVCDAMAESPALRAAFERTLVQPLVAALALVRAHAVLRVDPEDLHRELVARARQWPEFEALDEEELAALRARLAPGGDRAAVASLAAVPAVLAVPAVIEELAGLVGPGALASPLIRWAVVDLLAIFLEALERRAARTSERGVRLAAAIDGWSAEMPIAPLWPTLSPDEIVGELGSLRRTLLRAPSAQRRFLRRLVRAFPRDERVRDAVTVSAIHEDRS